MLSILRRLGASARLSLVAVFLQAQLGKYVPGAIWQYAGRGALAKMHGVPMGSPHPVPKFPHRAYVRLWRPPESHPASTAASP